MADADPSDGQEDVQKAYAADRAAERRVKQDGPEQGKVAQKKVLFPIDGPRQIEQQRAHFEREYNEKCAINPVHPFVEIRPGWIHLGSADRLLKSCDALGYVAVVDVHRIDLRKTL